jgi:hypothetical protein
MRFKGKLLHFGVGNAKLGSHTLTFSLPAGWTCPGAALCHTRVARSGGRVEDLQVADENRFRCFSAVQEAVYTEARQSRWNNFDLLQRALHSEGTTADRIHAAADLILHSMPEIPLFTRIHVSGDFFSDLYLRAWIHVARNVPECLFYGYTKSIPLWVAHKASAPDNFRLVASVGSKFDDLIVKHRLVFAKVVGSPEEAEQLGLPIDHDDSFCRAADRSFGLLVHAQQIKGTKMHEQALQLKRRGIKNGYAKKAKLLSRVSARKAVDVDASQI